MHGIAVQHSGLAHGEISYVDHFLDFTVALGLDLAHGGHLTHGMHLNVSGILYDFVSYGVDPETHRLDMDQVARLAREHKPKLIVAGASAYPREIPHERFAEIAEEVGAKLLVDMAHYAGLVAAGVHHNPVECADFVTTTTHKTLRGPRGGMVLCKQEHAKSINRSVFPGLQGGPLMHIIAGKAVCFGEALTDDFKAYGQQVVDNAKALADALMSAGLSLVSNGTDNHLMLIDLRNKNITGKEAEKALVKAEITANKNMVPFDDKSPFVTSGIRIGAAAITTRGLKETEMSKIVTLIDRVIQHPEDEKELKAVAKKVHDLMKGRPLFVAS